MVPSDYHHLQIEKVSGLIVAPFLWGSRLYLSFNSPTNREFIEILVLGKAKRNLDHLLNLHEANISESHIRILSLVIPHASLLSHVGKSYSLELTYHSLCFYANHTVLVSGFLIVYNQDYDF